MNNGQNTPYPGLQPLLKSQPVRSFDFGYGMVPGLALVALGGAELTQLVQRLVPPQLVPFLQHVAVTWHWKGEGGTGSTGRVQATSRSNGNAVDARAWHLRHNIDKREKIPPTK